MVFPSIQVTQKSQWVYLELSHQFWRNNSKQNRAGCGTTSLPTHLLQEHPTPPKNVVISTKVGGNLKGSIELFCMEDLLDTEW